MQKNTATSAVAEAARAAAEEKRKKAKGINPGNLVKVYVLEYRVDAATADEDGIEAVLDEARSFGSCEVIDEEVIKGTA